MESTTDGTDLRQKRRDDNSEQGRPLSWPESQQVSTDVVAIDEGLWRELMTPVRERWHARSADPTLEPSQNAYALTRARRLERTYASAPEGCERVAVPVRCGCRRSVRTYTCRQHLVCAVCRVKRAKKLRARIRAGAEAADKELRGRMRPVLLTLTIRHTGDIGHDRRELVSGWRRFYKALRRRIGAFPYVGVHELTRGRDGLGHPHAHIIVWWPWFDWRATSRWPGLHELWTKCCPESVSLDAQTARSTRGAAKYLGKYVSKGVHTDDFSPELRARALAGTYGTRWVFSSVRFWSPFVPLCRCCLEPVVRDTVRLRVTSDIRWNEAKLASTRGGFLDDEQLRHYQFTISEVSDSE